MANQVENGFAVWQATALENSVAINPIQKARKSAAQYVISAREKLFAIGNQNGGRSSMNDHSSNRKAELLDYIRARHAESWTILEKLGDEDREQVVYTTDDNQWSVQKVVSHLADAEIGMLGQARRASQGKVTVPADFDLERWNRRIARESERNTIDEFRNQILETHREILAFLNVLEGQTLDIEGRHSGGDILSVEGFLRRIASHRLEHAQDIQKALHK